MARAVREWIAGVGAKTAFIEPGPPWENVHCESFDSKLRDEPPDGEILHPPAEARIVVGRRRRPHAAVRPHASPGRKPPAPQAPIRPTAPPRPRPP